MMSSDRLMTNEELGRYLAYAQAGETIHPGATACIVADLLASRRRLNKAVTEGIGTRAELAAAKQRIEAAYIALRQTLSDYLQHDIDCHRTASLENDCSCWRQAIHRVAAGLDTPHGETGERTIAQIPTPDTPSEASDG
jgi:hypothetical protein